MHPEKMIHIIMDCVEAAVVVSSSDDGGLTVGKAGGDDFGGGRCVSRRRRLGWSPSRSVDTDAFSDRCRRHHVFVMVMASGKLSKSRWCRMEFL